MDTSVLVAIIGSAGTVLAALVSVWRGQRSFREESSNQHGALMSMVELISDRTDDIYADLRVVRDNLHEHIADHAKAVVSENVITPPAPARKKAASKKAK